MSGEEDATRMQRLLAQSCMLALDAEALHKKTQALLELCSEIADQPSLQKSLQAAQAGACDVLVHALQFSLQPQQPQQQQQQQQQRVLMEECLRAILVLTSPTGKETDRVDENIARLAECKPAPAALVSALNALLASPLPGDQDIVAAIFFVMSGLCKVSKQAGRLFKAGGCEPITRALLQFMEDDAVVDHGCVVVTKMSSKSTTIGAGFVRQGICGVLVDALRRHGEVAVLAGSIGGAVRALTTSEEADVLFVHAGACEPLVNALARHLAHPDAAEQLSVAIRNLGVPSEHRPLLRAAGAIPLFTSLVANFSSLREGVVESAVVFLRGMCADAESVELMAHGGVCEAVVRVAEQYAGNNQAIAHAVGVILSFVARWSPSRAEWAGAAAGVLTKILQLHGSHDGTAVAASVAVQDVMQPFNNDEDEDEDEDDSNGENDDNFVPGDHIPLCEALLAAMQTHCTNPFNVREGYATIAILCRTPTCARYFLTPEICKQLFELPRSVPDDAVLPIHVAWVAQVLCEVYGAANILSEHGACELLAGSLEKFLEHPNTVEQLCDALAALAWQDQANRLVASGAWEAAIAVLQQHGDVADIAAPVLRMAAAMGMQVPSSVEGTVTAGVCPLVVSAIRKHGLGPNGNRRVAGHGAQLVKLLMEHGDGEELLLQAGVIPTLTIVLREHIDESVFAVPISWAFGYLLVYAAEHPDSDVPRAYLARPMLEALSRHVDDPMVVEAVCCGLVALRADVPAGSELALVMLEAFDPLLRALQAHVMDMQLQFNVRVICSAMVNFTALPFAAPWVRGGAACPVVAATLQNWLAHREVMQPTLSLIVNLTMHSDECSAQLGELGVCVSVTEALRRYRALEDLSWRACAALANLARDADNAGRFAETDACQLVVQALGRHMQSVRLADAALDSITQLGADPRNCGRLVAAGACEAVVQALALHVEDPVVAARGFNAVVRLTFCEDGQYRNRLAHAGALPVLERLEQLYRLDGVPEVMQKLSNARTQVDAQ